MRKEYVIFPKPSIHFMKYLTPGRRIVKKDDLFRSSQIATIVNFTSSGSGNNIIITYDNNSNVLCNENSSNFHEWYCYCSKCKVLG